MYFSLPKAFIEWTAKRARVAINNKYIENFTVFFLAPFTYSSGCLFGVPLYIS